MIQEVYLTTFDMIHTHGFISIMSVIWGTSIVLAAPIIYLLKKTSYNKQY